MMVVLRGTVNYSVYYSAARWWCLGVHTLGEPRKGFLHYFIHTIEGSDYGSAVSEGPTLRMCQAAVCPFIVRQHCLNSEHRLVTPSAGNPGVARQVASIEGPADNR